MDSTTDLELYRSMYLIRRFEETVLENFPKGVFFGTTHTYLGQEANAVGVLTHLRGGDIVFSSHRCHGHFLAYGGDPRALFAELMGKTTGVCGGRGGSQHLHWKNFYSNGVQGGIVPISTGMALAEKIKGTGAITVVFLGDGTMGEGVIYEAFNMAALWKAPVLFVVENNRIAQTTPIQLGVAGDIPARLKAFGIPVRQLDTSDVKEIHTEALNSMDQVRSQQSPAGLVLHTYRFGPHSKGDDTRPPDEITHLREKRDPLIVQGSRLGVDARSEADNSIDNIIFQAFHQALDDPYPSVGNLQVTNIGKNDIGS